MKNLEKEAGNFEKFELVIADKQVKISDTNFYNLTDIQYDTLELAIARSSYATKDELIFRPFENLVIQFQYFGKDDEKCDLFLAKYQIILNESNGSLSQICFDGK